MMYAIAVVRVLWWRELLRTRKELSRWVGVILQPIIFWTLLGLGMADVFQVMRPEQTSLNALTYFFPGMIALCLLFTSLFGSMTLIEDRQSGFLQSMLIVPGPRWSLVLGKVLGIVSITCIQVGLLVCLIPVTDVSTAHISWPLLSAVVVMGAFGTTCLTFALAWVLNSTAAFHGVMSVVLLPLWAASGALFPVSGKYLGFLMGLNPMSYLVGGLKHSFWGGVIEGEPSLGLCVGVLGGFALIMFALAVRISQATQRSR